MCVADHLWNAWINGTRVAVAGQSPDAEFAKMDQPQHAELLLGQTWLPDAASIASIETRRNASVDHINDVLLGLKVKWYRSNASGGSKTEHLNASLAFLGELARVNIWREVCALHAVLYCTVHVNKHNARAHRRSTRTPCAPSTANARS